MSETKGILPEIVGKFSKDEMLEFAKLIYDRAIIDHYEDAIIDDESDYELLIIDVIMTMGKINFWGEGKENEEREALPPAAATDRQEGREG